MSFPEHPFWDFSLSFYRKPGVADACLYVQDRYGLNVNVILFCVWFARDGRGALSGASINALLQRIADWEASVIKPLREIRRNCRREALGIPEFLLQIYQPQIDSAELEAEHVEQLILAEFARGQSDAPGTRPGPGTPAADAAQSLRAYVGAMDVEADAQLEECLTAILHAAFDGAQFPRSAGDRPGS